LSGHVVERLGLRPDVQTFDPVGQGSAAALPNLMLGNALRNILTRAVPGLAADCAQRLLGTVLDRAGLHPGDVGAWITHAGGRDVLLALEGRLALQPGDLRCSAALLRGCGNLSSAFVYVVREAALADDPAPGRWWLSSFGAGFSCHGALLGVQ